MRCLKPGIDFAEDDISVPPNAELLRRLVPLTSDVKALAKSFAYGNLVREGLQLAIVGRPNVGKSSLFNRLLEKDRAIVTDIPGTTRDAISETAAIGGIPVKLVDTAGIRGKRGFGGDAGGGTELSGDGGRRRHSCGDRRADGRRGSDYREPSLRAQRASREQV